MKIIIQDNFNRDYISERPFLENADHMKATRIVIALNIAEGPDSENYYCVVKDYCHQYKKMKED